MVYLNLCGYHFQFSMQICTRPEVINKLLAPETKAKEQWEAKGIETLLRRTTENPVSR